MATAIAALEGVVADPQRHYYTDEQMVAIETYPRHPATAGIGVVCLFLGWTLIGWVVALAWAYNGDERRR